MGIPKSKWEDGFLEYDFDQIWSQLGIECQSEWPKISIKHDSEYILSWEVISQSLLSDIDNTGNVRVWPAEEFMAVWALKNQEMWVG